MPVSVPSEAMVTPHPPVEPLRDVAEIHVLESYRHLGTGRVEDGGDEAQ